MEYCPECGEGLDGIENGDYFCRSCDQAFTREEIQ